MFLVVNRMNRTASLRSISTDIRNPAVPMNPLRAEAGEGAAFP
jgi:hypothetical protein